MKIENIRITNLSEQEYRDAVDLSPYATPFHEYAFASLMGQYFNRRYTNVLARQNEREWVANVFTSSNDEAVTNIIGYGGPLPIEHPSDGRSELDGVTQVLGVIKKEVGARSVRALMYPSTFWPGEWSSETCKISLTGGESHVFNNTLTGNARTAVRKSQKSGVEVRPVNLADDHEVTRSVEILNITQQQVGSTYRTDESLFRSLSQLNDQQVRGQTIVATKDAAIIGVATYLYNSRELFHLFHGWDREFAYTCSNQALIWNMVQAAINMDIPAINMGQSHTESLLRAKLRWGGHLEKTPSLVVAG